MQRGGGAPLPPEGRQILPCQMEQALQRAIREQLLQDPEVRPNDHFLINIISNRLRHSYHSARMRVGEWMDNDLGVQEVMQQISRMLNSNERYQLDDSFSLHISHIRDPGRGSGNKRIKKATMALEKLLDVKKSVVKIKNDDELCCARAIVTMKAYCDFGSRDSHYDICDEVNPLKVEKPEHFTVLVASPKDRVVYPKSTPSKNISPSTRSLCCSWITIIKSSSKDHPEINTSFSSKWEIITTDVIPSLDSWVVFIFASIVKPVTKKTITRITRAKARNVTRVIKRDVWTLLQGKSLVTNALVVNAPSLGNNVWGIITFTPPPTEREPTWLKKSKASALPYARVKTVTDSSDPTRSKRVTCEAPPNVLPANNTTIFKLINVSFRIQRNWKKRGNYSNPENIRLTVPTLEKRKTISSFIGIARRCKTRASTCPI